jgi:hypothetical protein
MISALLIALAAIFNAVMDAVENENFTRSIFKNLPERFWYKRESWATARKIGGYKLDAWHLAKSAVVICFCLAIVLYQPLTIWPVDFIIFGLIWNIFFNLFYSDIFL